MRRPAEDRAPLPHVLDGGARLHAFDARLEAEGHRVAFCVGGAEREDHLHVDERLLIAERREDRRLVVVAAPAERGEEDRSLE